MSNDPNESDDSTEFEEFQEDDPREMTETEDCTNNYELRSRGKIKKKSFELNKSKSTNPSWKNDSVRSRNYQTSETFETNFNNKSNRSWKCLFVFLSICFVMIGAILMFPSVNYQKRIELYNKNFKELISTSDFNIHLPKHGKKVLRAVFREALKKPKSPVVLLLIGSESQKGVISNISQQTLNVFTTGQPHQTLNLKTINIKSSDTGVEIENYFKDALEDNQQSTLLIEDLEQLSTSALLTLHQYINEDESTYKNIFLIFTLKYIDDIKIRDSAKENYFNEIAISLLENLWANSGISKDKIDCIISRINKYLVILLNE